MRNPFIGILLAVWALGFSAYAAYPKLKLSFADIHSPVFNAKAIQVSLDGQQPSRLEVRMGEIVIQGRAWRNLHLSCIQFQLTDSLIHCASGRLLLSNTTSLPISFRYVPHKKILQVDIRPVANEKWQFSMHWNEDIWHSLLTITNGQVAHVANWLSDNEIMPVPSKGVMNGVAKLRGNGTGLIEVSADLLVDKLAFSDRSGLHAGEDINVTIHGNATRLSRRKQWLWKGEINWQHGAVFWQPIYFKGKNHRLSLNGTVNEKNIRLLKGNLLLADIGQFDFSGLMEKSGYIPHNFKLHAKNLELSVLFDQIIKPFLGETSFAEIKVTGQGGVAWSYQNGVNKSFKLDLSDATVIDDRERFSFHRINAHIPWKMDSATIADVSILSGQVLRIPLGKMRVPLEINDSTLKVPQLVLPLLDGALKIEDFSASRQDDHWRWQFSGEILPLSMDKLTEAVQIQQMHGTLSGIVPKVSYDGTSVTVDGSLLFNVFDGTVVAKELTLLNPLGLVPYLNADLEMRNLDLDLLTRTFSFGRVQGRIDMDVLHLELANWSPIKFDARLQSSPGSYPRRISQAAIENISALGGASASAAIQRSFLRFFEEFGYSKIGWRCSLRKNVCRMGGIEPKSQGYVLVKGGGVPAITVMGYNRDVGWQELINRLKRITQGGEPIIQ
tara:strand:+ start:1234 stop:3240 length:2007 start_codon:yes stop_codon:yes gene_type:complete